MERTSDPTAPLSSDDIHLAAHLFNPVRLTLARELRGWTKATLAQQIGKTPSAVSQFEAGLKPDAKSLAAMALALGLPIGFFARRSTTSLVSGDGCHFRSLRSASQRTRRQLLARGTLLCDLVDFIDEHVEWPEEQISKVACHQADLDSIEKYAAEVRKAWGLGLGPIPNMARLLESKGVLVSFVPDECHEVDAFSGWHRARPFVFLVATKGSGSRTRLDAGHELGHLVMHADVNPGNPELERQANRFGAAFLAPKESFLPECPTRLDWDHFYELKRRWKISVAALVRRAFDLGCLSEASYRRAFVQLNRTGERFHEADELDVEEPSLLSRSLEMLSEDFPVAEIAAHLGISLSDLDELVRA